MNGVLVIDKPSGPTSHDVVARVRRLFPRARIGHAGTLDPLATGVLVLLCGRATRLAQFLSGDAKSYRATITLGTATDTYDVHGTPVAPATGPERARLMEHERRWPSREQVETALDRFRGSFLQTPPPYSAKKIGGVRAYALARAARPVTPRAVAVHVAELIVATLAPPTLELDITCSAGFYVRSLAHDLGGALGCGAHLAALERTRSGDFTVDQAMPLADVELDPDYAATRLIGLDDLLPGAPAVRLTPAGAERARHGNTLEPQHATSAPTDEGREEVGPIRLLDEDAHLIALALARTGAWPLHPRIVLD